MTHDHHHENGHSHNESQEGFLGRLLDRHAHGHSHGQVDPTIATSDRGIWALKWSFVVLILTAVLQAIVVAMSGSVALLADTIHNVADAATAIPLWVAFILARRPASDRFTFGLGRVEDLAGLVIVLVILSSALVALWQAIDRLIHPAPVTNLLAVVLAGLVGFAGNEIAAFLRIRTGKEIASAALIADGQHARIDALTSLAVIVGAAGVWLGFPIADPIVGLAITGIIFTIVWQSAKAVVTRMLDGVEPAVVEELRHSAGHVEGVVAVRDVRARWVGHRLYADMTIAVDAGLSIAAAQEMTAAIRKRASQHVHALERLHIETTPHVQRHTRETES